MQITLYDSRQTLVQPIVFEPQPKAVSRPRRSNSYVKTLSRHFGYNLLVLALGGIIFTTSPVIIPQIVSELQPKAEIPLIQTTFEEIARKEQEKKAEEEKRRQISEEAQKYGVATDFSLVIPKISAAAKVVANVDPTNEEEYRNALKLGVAHSISSSFPGNKGTIYLFAHSTNTIANISRYNAIFFQLKDLVLGDKIIVFYAGQKYIYQVIDKQTTEANDVKWIADESEEKLVLQTCWPPGTSLKRLIVVARPV